MKAWKRRLLLPAVLALCLTACASKPAPVPETAAPTLTETAAPAPTATPAPEAQSRLTPEELALDYLARKYNCRVYTAANAPETPEGMDIRVEGLNCLGEQIIYETVGVAYELVASTYTSTRDAAGEKVMDWVDLGADRCLVLERSGYDGSWQGVLGEECKGEDEPLKDFILRLAWGLMDAEVSLALDGSPRLMGPGGEMSYIFPGEVPAVTVLEGWEPIYYEGDAWRSYEYKDLTALCYHSAAEDKTTINRIEASRADVSTYRGVRVGDSREAVLAAYPGLFDSPYWDYKGDYLWYGQDGETGLGAALLFWFEDGAVVRLELINMFN